MTALLPLAAWVPILDGEASAVAMYERHYSAAKSLPTRRARGTTLFVGPGNKLVLAAPCRRALFVWRRERYRADGQTGVNCAIFRNEGAGLSSDLIRAADAVADARWPGERHFTFVDPVVTAARRSRSSRPGECFYRADWTFAGLSGRGLHILERV